MKIALFGTSADPPTLGHQAILEWLSNNFDLVAVWASDNPFKDHQTPLKDRMRMLEIVIEQLDTSNLILREDLSEPRSLHSVEKARKLWEDGEYFLVVGSDIVAQVPSWYKSKELLAKAKLLVIPRPGYEVKPDAIAKIKQYGGESAIASFLAPPTSSTAYREKRDPHVVSPLIENYIRQENLYKSSA